MLIKLEPTQKKQLKELETTKKKIKLELKNNNIPNIINQYFT